MDAQRIENDQLNTELLILTRLKPSENEKKAYSESSTWMASLINITTSVAGGSTHAIKIAIYSHT